MTKSNKFIEGDGYTKEGWETVSENPPITAARLAKARPFAEAFPELAATIKTRGKQKHPTKELVTLRLNQKTLAAFKALGRGWQTQMDDVLTKAAKKLPARSAQQNKSDYSKYDPKLM